VKRMRSAVLLLFGAAACATAPPMWVPAGASFTPDSGRYSLELPAGWMRLNEPGRVFASKDGPFLQRIDVRVLEVGKPLPGIKKLFAPGMLPQEAAEVAQDEILSAPGMQGATLLENAPASLGGRPGYKLVVGYKDADGLKMRGLIYGALDGDAVYQLIYRAPERYYFQRDLPTFEQVRASFRIRAPGAVRASAVQ